MNVIIGICKGINDDVTMNIALDIEQTCNSMLIN